MSKQAQRLWLGQKKQGVDLRDAVLCSGDTCLSTSVAEVSSLGPKVIQIIFCGVCVAPAKVSAWRFQGSGAVEPMHLFWVAGVIVIVFALIITKIWDGWKNSLPTPPTAEEPRRAFLLRAPHLTFLFSLHPVFLATSYARSPLSTSSLIVFPSNCISQSLRYACNRPPLSWYHARQAIA